MLSDAEEADQIEDVIDDDEGGLKSEEESDDEEEADGDGSLGLLEVDAMEGEMEGEKGAQGKSRRSEDSPLFKSLMEPDQTVDAVLKKWTKEGKPLGRDEVKVVMLELRRRGLFAKALLVMEWLLKNKCFDLVGSDYASHLDLIAKVHGLHRAELFLYQVPESFRDELVYGSLLANCVSRGNIRKAEEVFDIIRVHFPPITRFHCDQLLLLYKRTDPKKITRILDLMEEEGIRPFLNTYKLLMEIKARAKDVGMEEIIEMIKSRGMEPDLRTQAMVARHYISRGHSEKAEAILKEIEGGEDIKNNRSACSLLLPLYASLGKDAEMERIWKACENDASLDECSTAIEAWGEVGKIVLAERIFNHMVEKEVKMGKKKWSSKHYAALLKVYAKHKVLDKGKDLANRIAVRRRTIFPSTWDAIVKFYAEAAGEVEKAEEFLKMAVQEYTIMWLDESYLTIMEKYAERGDVHNAERIMYELNKGRRVGMRQYQILLQAYIISKRPAYGFRERMKADKLFPDTAVAARLAIVDGFNFQQPPPVSIV